MLESHRLTSHARDDGFREIQLNGKQLVFVFMAATVVSVVIFLCGVLVGRGVRGEREATTAAAPGSEDIRPAYPGEPKPPTVVQPGDDPTKALPPAPPAGDAARGSEIVKPAGGGPEAKPAAASAVPAVAAAAPKAEASAPKPAAKAEPAPKNAGEFPAVDDPRRGWVIQVAAVKTRVEADDLAKRLGSKGYTAFVLSGNSNVFRVRVGGYKSKRDAETVAAKLRKEERFNPWVTR